MFANFTIGIIGHETKHLFECLKLYEKFINKSEIWHMLRGNIAASLLNFLLDKLYLVNCYDISNVNVFILSLLETFQWSLIHFDQFSYSVHARLIRPV